MVSVELPIDFESEAKSNGYISNGHAANGHESNGHAGNGFVQGSKSEGYDAEPGAIEAVIDNANVAESDEVDLHAALRQAEPLHGITSSETSNGTSANESANEVRQRIRHEVGGKLHEIDELINSTNAQTSPGDERFKRANELLNDLLHNPEYLPYLTDDEKADIKSMLTPLRMRRDMEEGHPAPDLKDRPERSADSRDLEEIMELLNDRIPNGMSRESKFHRLDELLERINTDTLTPEQRHIIEFNRGLVKRQIEQIDAQSDKDQIHNDIVSVPKADSLESSTKVHAESPKGAESHSQLEGQFAQLAKVDELVERRASLVESLDNLKKQGEAFIGSVDDKIKLVNMRTVDAPEFHEAVTEVDRIEHTKDELLQKYSELEKGVSSLDIDRQTLTQLKNNLINERGSFSKEQGDQFAQAGEKISELARTKVQLQMALERANDVIQVLQRRLDNFRAAVQEVAQRNEKVDASAAKEAHALPKSEAGLEPNKGGVEEVDSEQNALRDRLVEASASILILDGRTKELSGRQAEQLGYLRSLVDSAAGQLENAEFLKQVKLALDQAAALENQFDQLKLDYEDWTKVNDDYLAPKAQPDGSAAGRELAETLLDFQKRKNQAVESFNRADDLHNQLMKVGKRLIELVPAVASTEVPSSEVTPSISPELVAQNEYRKSNVAMDIERRKGQILAIVGTLPPNIVEQRFSKYGSAQELNAEVVRLTWEMMQHKDEIAKIKQDVAGADDDFAWKVLVKRELEKIRGELAEAAGIKDLDVFLQRANIPIPKPPLTFPEGGSAPTPPWLTYPEKLATTVGSTVSTGPTNTARTETQPVSSSDADESAETILAEEAGVDGNDQAEHPREGALLRRLQRNVGQAEPSIPTPPITFPDRKEDDQLGKTLENNGALADGTSPSPPEVTLPGPLETGNSRANQVAETSEDATSKKDLEQTDVLAQAEADGQLAPMEISKEFIDRFHQHDEEIRQEIGLLAEQAKGLRREFDALCDSIHKVDDRPDIDGDTFDALNTMHEKINLLMEQGKQLNGEVEVHRAAYATLEADNKRRGAMVNPRAWRDIAAWKEHLDLQDEYAKEIVYRAIYLQKEYIGLTDNPPGWKAELDQMQTEHQRVLDILHTVRRLDSSRFRFEDYKEGLASLGVEAGKALDALQNARERQLKVVEDEVTAMKDEVVAVGLDIASLPSFVANNAMSSVGSGIESAAGGVARVYNRLKSRYDAVNGRRADAVANWKNRSETRRKQAELLRMAYRQRNSGETK